MSKKVTDLPELEVADSDDLLTFTDVSTSESKVGEAGAIAGVIPTTEIGAQPYCFINLAESQSIPSLVWTDVAFNEAIDDNYGWFENGSIRVPDAGMYMFFSHFSLTSMVVGKSGYSRLLINGNPVDVNTMASYNRAGNPTLAWQMNNIMILEAGDLLTAGVYNGDTVARNIIGTQSGESFYYYNTYMKVVRLCD